MEKSGETIEKVLVAVSEADKWMRANPKQAAQVATRWIPGLKADVAEAIVNVMTKHPELFSDMPTIPADVAIKPGFVFKP